MRKKPTISRMLRDECYKRLESVPHNLTRKSYRQILRRYIEYCRNNFNVKTMDELCSYAQCYSYYLQDSDYSPSTVHTYLAAICYCFKDKLSLSMLDKPIRHVSDFWRGHNRQKSRYRSKEDLSLERFSNLVTFQAHVGVRREELRKLQKEDLIQKEDGNWYVVVRCGKGGKRTLVYIDKEHDLPIVKPYFDKAKAGEYIFKPEEFANDLSLHYLRAQRSQSLYQSTIDKLKNNPEYRKELEDYVRQYWRENNLDKKTKKPKPFPEKSIHGVYILRGANRRFAQKNSLPYVYDRLALKFVSMCQLGHFRESISILYLNYI